VISHIQDLLPGFFGPIVKNYGAHTIDDMTHCLRRNNFEIVHEEGPEGRIVKYYSIVFRKIE